MTEINSNRYEDTIVLHFGGEVGRINAYTLATAIVGFADAVKAANSVLNPGFEVEVSVEALGPGSFKTMFRTKYQGSGNLFTGTDLRAIVLSVVASVVYQHTLAPENEIKIVVNDNHVVVENGSDRVIIPREIFDSIEQVEKSKGFRDGIGRVFQSVEKDVAIKSFGFSPLMTDRGPDIPIPRERFPQLSTITESANIRQRELEEITEVQITRAILERSRKKWQFVWRGLRISAPVVDMGFYDSFFAHDITIAPGDSLKVKLKLTQKSDPDTGVWINDPNGYEVVAVMDHVPRGQQTSHKL